MHAEERKVAGVGGEDALTEAEPAVVAGVEPFGLARQQDQRIVACGAARIAHRNKRHGAAAVVERQLRGRPDEVPQIGRRIELDAGDPLEGNPVVLAVDARLQGRTDARVRIGDPLERRAVDAARRRRGRLEGLCRKHRRQGRLALSLLLQGFQQLRQPGKGLADHHRGSLAGEDLRAHEFAANGVADRLAHRTGRRVEIGGNVQLGMGTFPLPQHAEQLSQEHAQGDLIRSRPHCSAQMRQRALRIAATNGRFRERLGIGLSSVGHGCK